MSNDVELTLYYTDENGQFTDLPEKEDLPIYRIYITDPQGNEVAELGATVTADMLDYQGEYGSDLGLTIDKSAPTVTALAATMAVNNDQAEEIIDSISYALHDGNVTKSSFAALTNQSTMYGEPNPKHTKQYHWGLVKENKQNAYMTELDRVIFDRWLVPTKKQFRDDMFSHIKNNETTSAGHVMQQPAHIVSNDLIKHAQEFKAWVIKQPMFKEADNQGDMIESINTLMTAIHNKPPAIVWEAAVDVMHEMPFESDDGPDEWNALYDAVDAYREQYHVTTTNVYDSKGSRKVGQPTFSVLLTNDDNQLAAELTIILQADNTDEDKPQVVFNLNQNITPLMQGLNQNEDRAHGLLRSIENEINCDELSAGEVSVSKRSQQHQDGVKTRAQDFTWSIVQNKRDSALTAEELSFSETYDVPEREDYLQNLEHPTSGMKP